MRNLEDRLRHFEQQKEREVADKVLERTRALNETQAQREAQLRERQEEALRLLAAKQSALAPLTLLTPSGQSSLRSASGLIKPRPRCFASRGPSLPASQR